MSHKTIILDYIGTLVEPYNYNLESSRQILYTALCEAGLVTDVNKFMGAYKTAHEKYRRIRYQKLKEVTNAVWVSEALSSSGCKVAADDHRLKTGLNVFFNDFINSLILRTHAKELLSKVSTNGKVGLISNFTYAPAIYASLRKLGINRYFNAVLISDSFGWRKPHRKIFEEALKKLQTTAEETVYVGDSPIEDIKGAKAIGLKTIFIPSRFYSIGDLVQCNAVPDIVAKDLRDVFNSFELANLKEDPRNRSVDNCGL